MVHFQTYSSRSLQWDQEELTIPCDTRDVSKLKLCIYSTTTLLLQSDEFQHEVSNFHYEKNTYKSYKQGEQEIF